MDFLCVPQLRCGTHKNFPFWRLTGALSHAIMLTINEDYYFKMKTISRFYYYFAFYYGYRIPGAVGEA
jgi:hypothetical protein